MRDLEKRSSFSFTEVDHWMITIESSSRDLWKTDFYELIHGTCFSYTADIMLCYINKLSGLGDNVLKKNKNIYKLVTHPNIDMIRNKSI